MSTRKRKSEDAFPVAAAAAARLDRATCRFDDAAREALFQQQLTNSPSEFRARRLVARGLVAVILPYRTLWLPTGSWTTFALVSAAYLLVTITLLVTVSVWRLRAYHGRAVVVMFVLHHVLLAVDYSNTPELYAGNMTSLSMFALSTLVARADFVPMATLVLPSLIPAALVIYLQLHSLFPEYLAIVLTFPLALLLCLALTWFASRRARRQADAQRGLAVNFAISKNVLSTVLPAAVAGELLSADRREVIADDEASLSVVFIYLDMAGLVRAGVQHGNIARLASRAVTALDELRDELRGEDKRAVVDRVDAYIDMYIAVAGRGGSCEGKHALAALRFARMACDRLRRDVPPLEGRIRIGVASGAAVGGIAGRVNLVYSVFGDPVNSASRMASTAAAGTVQVAPTTHQQLIKEKTLPLVELESRGMLDIKGKGSIYVRILRAVHVGSAKPSAPSSPVITAVARPGLAKEAYRANELAWSSQPRGSVSDSDSEDGIVLASAGTTPRKPDSVPGLVLQSPDGRSRPSSATSDFVSTTSGSDRVSGFASSTARLTLTQRLAGSTTGRMSARSARWLAGMTGRDGEIGGMVDSATFLERILRMVPRAHPMTRLLQFRDRDMEMTFLDEMGNEFVQQTAVLLACLLATLVVFLVHGITDLTLSESSRVLLIGVHVGAIVVSAAQIALAVLAPSTFRRHAVLALVLPLLLTAAATVGVVRAFVYEDATRYGGISGMVLTIIMVSGLLPIKVAAPICFIAAGILSYAPVLINPEPDHRSDFDDKEDFIFQILVLCILTSIVVPLAMSQARTVRFAFAMNAMAGDAATRVENLVHSILPVNVAERLKARDEMERREQAEQEEAPDAVKALKATAADDDMIMDTWDDALVIATDLVGFTTMCSTRKAPQVFADVSGLFEQLDTISENHGLLKLCTIGDAYVAMLPCAAVVTAAQLEMIGAAMVAAANCFNLKLRIGAARGMVSAGLIGPRSLPVYRPWGPAFDESQRCESRALPGCMNLSSAAAAGFVFGVESILMRDTEKTA